MIILQFIRSALFSYVAIPLLTLLICVIGLPSLALPRRYFIKVIKLWVRCESLLERVLLGLKYEVRGVEHLPQSGAFIVAAKHQSTFETYKLHELFADPAIILKKELLSIPLWGMYLKKSGVIAIDRSTPQRAASSVRDGAARVAAEGRPIIIFPQGTRVPVEATPDDVSYKPGIFRIQEATGLPIIPMAINSGVFWPKGSLLKRPGTVVLEFLPAINVGLDRPALMARLEDQLETRSNALAAEAKQAFLPRSGK